MGFGRKAEICTTDTIHFFVNVESWKYELGIYIMTNVLCICDFD